MDDRGHILADLNRHFNYDLGPQSLAYTVYMRIMKVKGQAGQQLKWKQTDGETDIQTDRQTKRGDFYYILR